MCISIIFLSNSGYLSIPNSFFYFSFFTIILIPKNTINTPTKIFNIFEIFSGIKLDSIVPDIAIKVKKIIVDETSPTENTVNSFLFRLFYLHQNKLN